MQGNTQLQPPRQQNLSPSSWPLEECWCSVGEAAMTWNRGGVRPSAGGSSGPFPMGRTHKAQLRPGAGDAGQDSVILLGKASSEQTHPAPACCCRDRKHARLVILSKKSRAYSHVLRQVSAVLMSPADFRVHGPNWGSFHSTQPIPAPGLKPPCLQTERNASRASRGGGSLQAQPVRQQHPAASQRIGPLFYSLYINYSECK